MGILLTSLMILIVFLTGLWLSRRPPEDHTHKKP